MKMLTEDQIYDKYLLAIREWAYFQDTNAEVMTSIKFGEVWAYGTVLGKSPHEITEDMSVHKST